MLSLAASVALLLAGTIVVVAALYYLIEGAAASAKAGGNTNKSVEDNTGDHPDAKDDEDQPPTDGDLDKDGDEDPMDPEDPEDPDVPDVPDDPTSPVDNGKDIALKAKTGEAMVLSAVLSRFPAGDPTRVPMPVESTYPAGKFVVGGSGDAPSPLLERSFAGQPGSYKYCHIYVVATIFNDWNSDSIRSNRKNGVAIAQRLNMLSGERCRFSAQYHTLKTNGRARTYAGSTGDGKQIPQAYDEFVKHFKTLKFPGKAYMFVCVLKDERVSNGVGLKNKTSYARAQRLYTGQAMSMTFLHETGHLLGLGHAGTVGNSYGGRMSHMSTGAKGGQCLYDINQQWYLGWVRPGNCKYVEKGATYALGSPRVISDRTKGLFLSHGGKVYTYAVAGVDSANPRLVITTGTSGTFNPLKGDQTIVVGGRLKCPFTGTSFHFLSRDGATESNATITVKIE